MSTEISASFGSGIFRSLSLMLTPHQSSNLLNRNLSLDIDIGIQSLTAQRTVELLLVDPIESDEGSTFRTDPLPRQDLVAGIGVRHGNLSHRMERSW